MRTLIFSNIFIALAAVALTFETFYLLGAAPAVHQTGSWGLGALVFFATLFVYNLDRLVSASREDAVEVTERHRWIRARRKWLWAAVSLSTLGGLVSLAFVPVDVLWGLVPLGAISLAYSLPVIAQEGKKLRLKDLPGLKIFLIALVWASVTVVLPALAAGADLFGADTALAFVERTIFIFAITLPFDVRDLERDRQAGIRTLPMKLGAARTRWLAVGLMVVFVAIVVAHYGLAVDGATVPLVASGLLTAVALWFSDEVRGAMYYVGFLDGMMLVQGAMVVFFLISLPTWSAA
ncbi:MAG: UbiA family prenyltransferase [Persicimonas sp.]